MGSILVNRAEREKPVLSLKKRYKKKLYNRFGMKQLLIWWFISRVV